jgi:putative hemolysin
MRESNGKAAYILKLIDSSRENNAYFQVVLTVIIITAVSLSLVFLCEDLSYLIGQNQNIMEGEYCTAASVTIIILLTSFFSMLILESIPRRIAQCRALRIAVTSAGTIRFFSILAYIPRTILDFFANLILRILRIKPPPVTNGATEEMIIDMIDEGARTGEIDLTEQELIKSVFQFSETTASQCMTPRTEVSAINIADEDEKILHFIREEGYSRYPVFRDDLDHIEGIIYTRDIIDLLHDRKLIIIQDIIHPAYFVPDSKKIAELLKDFQASQVHMAVVLDEFGGTAGIITIEDIIEELVGEIQDEFDVEEEEFRLLRDGLAEVHASMDVDDFNEFFDAELPEDKADTIGGLIFTHLGELPDRRQKVRINGVEFTIATLEGNRIEKVIAKRIVTPEGQQNT